MIRGLTRNFFARICHSKEDFYYLSRKYMAYHARGIRKASVCFKGEKMTLQEYLSFTLMKSLIRRKGLIPHFLILSLTNKKIHTSHHKKYGLAHFEVFIPTHTNILLL